MATDFAHLGLKPVTRLLQHLYPRIYASMAASAKSNLIPIDTIFAGDSYVCLIYDQYWYRIRSALLYTTDSSSSSAIRIKQIYTIC